MEKYPVEHAPAVELIVKLISLDVPGRGVLFWFMHLVGPALLFEMLFYARN